MTIFIILHISWGCVTAPTTPEKKPVAALETLPPKPIISQVNTQPKPQAPPPADIVCRPVLDEASASHFVNLGYTINSIEVFEEKSNAAKLMVKRQSLVGGIPMDNIEYESTRYHAKSKDRYGEWDESEHWIRLKKKAKGYSGRFVLESEFFFSVNCR